MKRKLEICCYSTESAFLAEKAGADRIELCDNFTEGGTTPSYATIKYAVANLKIPVNVIIRPRGGDFLYSDMEFEIMKQEVLEMKKLGVNGIVFGILKSNGEIDIARTKEIQKLAHPLELTFHRAFDMCKNHLHSLEILKKLGINRILTSGGKNKAYDGIELLSKLVEVAGNEIIIMPGGGINENTIGEIVQQTGALEYHSSAKTFINSTMNYFNLDIVMGKDVSMDEYKKVSVHTEQIKKMKKILKKQIILFTLMVLIVGCHPNKKLPRIAIAGFGIESSTFSPAVTEEDAFYKLLGQDILDRYPYFKEGFGNYKRATWYPTLIASATPGGIVSRKAYESLVKQILDGLEENLPYDAMYLQMHGAMSVEGLDDADANFVERIREVIGDEVIISVCMDLHGNVSKRLASNLDLITCYRLAPHEDAMESRQRAVENLLDRLENGKGKPKYKAWIPVPILLPGEKTSTRVEPAKSLYAKLAPATAQEGILDASIWVGYPWADEPRNHAVVMVTGDEEVKVKSTAEKLAKHFWDVRNEFDFIAPVASLDASLDAAINSEKHPFIISDMGDNPTAGGAGDVTWTLNEILKRPEFMSENGPSIIYASIPGEKFVEKSVEVGIGGKVKEYVGALVDSRYAPPILLSGKIMSIKHGDINAKTEVVVKVGSVYVIVTKKRKPYHYEKDFTNLGLKPRESDILVVKIGYLVPELYNMRADWIMALTPGGVDQNIEGLEYNRVIRPMFPLDKNMKKPNLKAVMIPVCGGE